MMFQIKLGSFALMALAVSSVTASPLTNAQAEKSVLDKRSDFHYRFYSNPDCDHNDSSVSTSPYNSQAPNDGNVGVCYDSPYGVNWERLEIDNNFSGTSDSVVTFCNNGCQGGESDQQKGTYCYVPPDGCAIGSFGVISLTSN